MIRKLKQIRIQRLKQARNFWPRFVGAPYPTSADLKALISERCRLTAVARLPWCKRFDRPLSWMLGIKPRYLSNRVSRFKCQLDGGILSLLQHWLWKQYSPVRAAFTSVLIAINVLLLSFAIGAVLCVARVPEESYFSWASPDLVATAGYAGSIFSILQALLLFAVQLRPQQNGTSLQLALLYARKYHSFEILALSSGVAVANLSAAILDPTLVWFGIPEPWANQHYGPLLLLNLVLLPAMTAFSLWMLAGIIADAGDDTLDEMRPVIRSAMIVAAEEDALLVQTTNLFLQELETMGVHYTPFAHTSNRHTVAEPTDLDIGVEGTFRDVDCVALEKAIAQATQNIPLAIEFASFPGQDWAINHGAIAKTKESLLNENAAQARKKQVERGLRRAIVVDRWRDK